jgi:tetratricopeptide (TPR) repeat protein
LSGPIARVPPACVSVITSTRPPADAQRKLQAGFDAFRARDLPRAVAICKEILAAYPAMGRAHYLAAMIALASNDRTSAVRALETTVRLNEGNAAAWTRLAELYATGGALRRAEACLQNAASTQQGNAATLDHIGTVFRLVGNLQASLEWHRRASDANPEHVPFQVNLANAHMYLGDRDAAREILEAAARLDPDNAQVHWLLSRAGNATSRVHIDTMSGMLSGTLTPQSIAYLQYAIGKELEDLGDWPGAFAAWSAGAAARRECVAYDEAAEIELFETLENTFTAEWLNEQQSDCADAGPVFIVGEPRTGTTLLDRMLDAHPAVTSAGELRHFGIALRQVTGSEELRQFSANLVRQAATADVSAIGEAYIDMTSGLRLDAPHIVDKLPSNYLYLPLILAALPNARVIQLCRDPMDTCLAIFKQLFADAYLYSYDLGELARHYRRYQRLMGTWRERFAGRFIDVDYEALVSAPEETLRPVLQFIGLSWNDACLEYFSRDSAVTTASAYQVREAPHQRSVNHWKHFASELAPVHDLLTG